MYCTCKNHVYRGLENNSLIPQQEEANRLNQKSWSLLIGKRFASQLPKHPIYDYGGGGGQQIKLQTENEK